MALPPAPTSRAGPTIRIHAAALLGGSLAIGVLWATQAAATKKPCIESCRERAAGCIEAECADLRGKARRTCKKTCRARTGCGGARTRTLAYVVTECRTSADGVRVGNQKLRIQRGRCDAGTISFCQGGTSGGHPCAQATDCPGGVCGGLGIEPEPDPVGLCRLLGEARAGRNAMAAGGVFTRLGVTPDGSGVVFEVTDDFGLIPPSFPSGFSLREGIFFVRADGSGLRRLAPPSRNPPFVIAPDPSSPLGLTFNFWEDRISFSPDGQRIVITDLGPGPAGEEAIQVVTVDLATGRRTQLTQLPPGRPPTSSPMPVTLVPSFVDNKTVVFGTFADADGSNPAEAQLRVFTVKTDGSGLRPAPVPSSIGGSQVVPIFSIVGGDAEALTIPLPGVSVNDTTFRFGILEVFFFEGRNLLQLTNFRRDDTTAQFLGPDGRRAFFIASGDPFGTNRSENCQFFSIDTLGRDLRQLTRFRQGDKSRNGCAGGPPPGCSIGWPAAQDGRTHAIVFRSSCDPFGTNPFGSQIFAMRPNGSRLRQLTHTRGMVMHADGGIEVELPGPWAYSGGR